MQIDGVDHYLPNEASLRATTSIITRAFDIQKLQPCSSATFDAGTCHSTGNSKNLESKAPVWTRGCYFVFPKRPDRNQQLLIASLLNTSFHSHLPTHLNDLEFLHCLLQRSLISWHKFGSVSTRHRYQARRI